MVWTMGYIKNDQQPGHAKVLARVVPVIHLVLDIYAEYLTTRY